MASIQAWIGPLIFVAGAAYLYYAYTQKKFPFDGSIMGPKPVMPMMMAVPSDPNADVMEYTRLTTDTSLPPSVNIGGTGASNQRSSAIPAVDTMPTMSMSPVVMGVNGMPVVINPPAIMPAMPTSTMPTRPKIGGNLLQNIISSVIPASRKRTMPITTPGPAPPPGKPNPKVDPLNPNAAPPPGYTLIPAMMGPSQVSTPPMIVPTNSLPPMMMTMVVMPAPSMMMAAPPPMMMPVMDTMTITQTQTQSNVIGPTMMMPPPDMGPPPMMMAAAPPSSNLPTKAISLIPKGFFDSSFFPSVFMPMASTPAPSMMAAAPAPAMMMAAAPPAMMAAPPPMMAAPSGCPPPPDPPHCDPPHSGYPKCFVIGRANGKCHPGMRCPSGHSTAYCLGWNAGAGV